MAWEITTIGEVAEINPRLEKTDIDDDTLASFVPMKCVEAESGRCDPPEIKKVGEVKKGYTPMQDGDVIMAKVTPCMENGKVAVVRALKNGIGFGSTEFFVLRPSERILPEYLFYFIIQQSFRREAECHMTGAVGLRRVPRAFLENHEIPLPPLPEQRRIVARIEELFSRLDAGVAALRHAKAQLQRYRQSVLAAAVTGQLTQEWREMNGLTLSDWESVNIDDISEVKTGKTPKRGEPQFWNNGTIPWLTSSATNNEFTHVADQFVTKAALDSGLKLFEPGTLLLAMYGEGKTRGQVTEITFQATCNQACAAIIVNDARAFRPFVKLRLQECYEQTRKAASGGNQPNLNLTKVREIPLNLPPLAEQYQIVAEVEARTTAIDHLEAELNRQITRTYRLRQATLATAFSGSLTT